MLALYSMVFIQLLCTGVSSLRCFILGSPRIELWLETRNSKSEINFTDYCPAEPKIKLE